MNLCLNTEWPAVSYTYIRVTPGFKFYFQHRSYGRWGLDVEFEVGPGVWK